MFIDSPARQKHCLQDHKFPTHFKFNLSTSGGKDGIYFFENSYYGSAVSAKKKEVSESMDVNE